MTEDDMYRYVSLPSWKPRTRFTEISMIRPFLEYVISTRTKALSLAFAYKWIRRTLVGLERGYASKRANCISRYLDWCAQQGMCTNPFAELQRKHGLPLVRIVEIVLRPRFRERLANQHPVKPWSSHLAPLMRARIDRMKTLGYKYLTRERDFYDLDLYLQDHPELAKLPVVDQVAQWAASLCCKSKRWAADYCARTLAMELARTDDKQVVPLPNTALGREVVRKYRKPHVFSIDDLVCLLEVAKNAKARCVPNFGIRVHAIISILCCTGIRIGELGRLKLKHVNLQENLLEVLDSKFFKSRLIPFTGGVGQIIRNYLVVRASEGAPQDPESPLWWSLMTKRAIGYSGLHCCVREVLRAAGLKSAIGREGPRVHDLRHSFATLRVHMWIDADEDTQNKLAYLATYLGHKDIKSTVHYLHYGPEIAERATRGLRDRISAAIGRLP